MVVLATKCYVEGDARERALDSLDSLVANDLAELAVEWTIGVLDTEFVSVTVDGDDETVARNLLRERWGEITDHFDDGETYVGTLRSWDDDGWTLDAGEPIEISRDDLGLGPGDPSQIRDRFGVVQHTPLRFVYDADGGHRLADESRDMLYDWSRSDDDDGASSGGRLNVNSATRGEVRATLNRAGHARDVITVERLGLLEQSVVCAEGTDPPGLLASVGEYLPAELKAVVP
ncbi:hypothetical protein SY89_02674 [Halolamina pelagica]|uniref:DUF2110 domain-containing protein n=1 Tax=Halolamina pelagica TaxID=699431 RepID=A0A0P7I4L9_9EURY|nr:DUF2110 family protein [Halolamina pelagica]KPN31917.1 hypothetical protein SY89_02674 [Halolamina pelagica]